LPGLVDEGLKSLPIPKVMRWGAGDAQFVRPVHGVVLLHGERVIAGKVLDIAAGRETAGHRFMSAGRISLKSAGEYEKSPADEGRGMAELPGRGAGSRRRGKE